MHTTTAPDQASSESAGPTVPLESRGVAEPPSAPAPAVSVLTPVYNVARYLPQCLESLQRQKLESIEFICINDGSTDNSLEILKRYAESDSRFRIIDKPNSGYGASMNQGLAAARGEYVGIVESDDFASPGMFKKLYGFAKKHDCDLVKSNYFEHADGRDYRIRAFHGFRYRRVFDPAENVRVLRVLPIIWAGLYRRQMLLDGNVRFNETPGASFQDTSFVFQAWVASRRAALLPGSYLHYRVDNAGSSVKSSTKIYEVCGEYATSEAYIKRDSRLWETFAPTLNAIKFDGYRWNYNRIAPEYREEFVARWMKEFRQSQEEGTLNQELFDPDSWSIVGELLAGDASAFAQRHPDEL